MNKLAFSLGLVQIATLLISVSFVILLVVFFRSQKFRKIRIRFKIVYNQAMAYFKHFYYMLKFIIRLTEFIKTFIIIGIVLGILFLIGLYIINLWNTYVSPTYNLPRVKVDFRRFSPIFFLGWLGGMLMSVFLKPKLERFADRVNAKPQMIYIFGSNEITKKLVENLIQLGLGPMTALIAEKSYYWIEALGAQLDLLILDTPDELKIETLYEKIGFKNALKIVILVEDKELAQNILVNIRRVNKETEIILLSQYRPPIIDLAGPYTENIRMIDNIETITNEIIRRLALGFDYAPVIEAKLPEDYIGLEPKALEEDFNHKVKVLGVKRKGKIILPEKFEKNDLVLLYLIDKKALREFLSLIPKRIEFEEIIERESETVEKAMKEKEVGEEKGES